VLHEGLLRVKCGDGCDRQSSKRFYKERCLMLGRAKGTGQGSLGRLVVDQASALSCSLCWYQMMPPLR
jgi:hypothetical protein